MSDREFDIVVFGATSFVGKILCRYLHDRFGHGGEVKWAMAGRSRQKLESVLQSLGVDEKQCPILQADSDDASALEQLCRQTRVLITTVGPYALYGESVVRACVETGTDYCDLAGEPQWIRRMLDKYENKARQSGARIVHCCGFDSVPSDLGVYFLQQQARKNGQPACHSVSMRVEVLDGEYSGGTLASIVNAAKETARQPSLLKQLLDPYSLCSSKPPSPMKQNEHLYPQYDKAAKSWVSPFIMASINTRVVHRSNALQKHAYGTDFRYDEAVINGAGAKGMLSSAWTLGGLAAFMSASTLPVTRAVLERWVLPKPGEGPSPESQEKGRYVLCFYGVRPDGSRVKVRVSGDRDPGYGSTAKILGEAAACLAFDVDKKSVPGGFWTPATALGEKLLPRLTGNAGLRFEVVP